MRKDVRIGLAAGGAAVVVIACSVLFFGNPDPEAKPPSPQAPHTPVAQSPAPDPNRNLSATHTDPGAGPGSISIGPSGRGAGGPDPLAPTHRDPAGGPLAGTTDAGAGAGDNSAGALPLAPSSRDWASLLENGGGPILSRTPGGPTPGEFTIHTDPGVGGAAGGNIGANVGGVSVPPGGVAAAAKAYIVQPGENFWSIAQREYGNGAYYSHLVRANPSVNPNKIKAGTSINIPDRSEVVPAAAAPSTAAPAVASVDSNTQYRVQQGDNLNIIAKKLYGGVEYVDKIYQLNKELIGPNPNALKLNMVLRLPAPPADSAPETPAPVDPASGTAAIQ